MTAQEFCYWLQGYFEIGDKDGIKKPDRALTHQQAEMIREHLGYVFAKRESDIRGPMNLGSIGSGDYFGTQPWPGTNPVVTC